MNSEVLIIGGGVIGLSIARELHIHGLRNITLLEKGVCGEESSWAAAGMLGPQAEADEGGVFLDLCLDSRSMYPQFADDLLAETGTDIELDRNGTLYLAFTEDDEQMLQNRLGWQKNAGLSVELLSARETRRAESFISPDVRMSLLFPDDWQVENRKLLDALRIYAKTNGIEIVENARVDRLISENGRIVGAKTQNETFLSESTVLATGAWSSLIKIGDAAMPFSVTPVRGQIISMRTAKRMFDHVIYSRSGYIVPRTDGRILTGSTSEKVGFTKGITDAAADDLKKAAFEIAPSLDSLSIADQWSGLRPFAADGLPVIGSIDGIDGLIVATAHYRNGILLAPLTAKLVADALVTGKTDERLEMFGPNRFRSVATAS